MAPATYNPAHKAVLDDLLLAIPGVEPGKMFGYPAYYIEGKLFACLYENGVGIKVPAAMAEELADQPGMSWFQPMGRRRMKEWIRIDRDASGEYRKDRAIFLAAVAYVSSRTQ
ncbi:MAG: TfoX/Sxy family protein [Methanoregula sp.]|jgi:TfoX/Sxy family transcriptional regulator of competence genes|uniref:TfoX/Sxy family protein n=1 Tax=Methanoregula sp. TaxID=2052170 RepID=UPI003C7455F3